MAPTPFVQVLAGHSRSSSFAAVNCVSRTAVPNASTVSRNEEPLFPLSTQGAGLRPPRGKQAHQGTRPGLASMNGKIIALCQPSEGSSPSVDEPKPRRPRAPFTHWLCQLRTSSAMTAEAYMPEDSEEGISEVISVREIARTASFVAYVHCAVEASTVYNCWKRTYWWIKYDLLLCSYLGE